jgi:uncharacterized membrane protein
MLMLSWLLTSKLLHILSAMLFVGGMLGRDLTFAAARRATEVQVTATLLSLSERFEKLMVRPGSELVFLFGLLTAWLERQPLFSAFAGARPAWVFVSLVIYLLTVPLVIVLVMPGTRRRRLTLEAALAQRGLTAELRRALDDRSVLVTRNVELLIILVVVGFMVLKPF